MQGAEPPQPRDELPPEKARVCEFLDRTLELEGEFEAELHRHQERVFEDLRLRRVKLEDSVRDAQRRARIGLRRWLEQSRPQSILSIPFIYGMAVPLVFLDFCLTVYQHVCFPALRHRNRHAQRVLRHRPPSSRLPQRHREGALRLRQRRTRLRA
jgi:hypothetical protein